VFNEDAMREHLLEKPAQYPGCSGARNLSDNLADLRAQTGANQKGINLISQLVGEYGLETVLVCLASELPKDQYVLIPSQFYMKAIQENAEIAVRRLLKDTHARFGGKPLEATEYMDDGSPIQLKITINDTEGTADFDFTGTGPEVYGRCASAQSHYPKLMGLTLNHDNQEVPTRPRPSPTLQSSTSSAAS
jgi:5-oxoprolinase (ATP-hydrolysing)